MNETLGNRARYFPTEIVFRVTKMEFVFGNWLLSLTSTGFSFSPLPPTLAPLGECVFIILFVPSASQSVWFREKNPFLKTKCNFHSTKGQALV